MRDPELVARAQRAAARLESAWERWRALQGLGETPAQPVVGYVGYALKEPWGQPRAVIGFSAEEAERLAELLERDGTDHGAADRGLEFAQRHVPAQPLTQVFPVTPASKSDVLAVTSQLPGSQLWHSFLPGSGARLRNTRAGNGSCMDVWARDGQAPARAQTLTSGYLRWEPPCQGGGGPSAGLRFVGAAGG
jgi:hypothetical protein